ncbi:Ig-like domain-containing protein [Pseudomonas sp. Hz4]
MAKKYDTEDKLSGDSAEEREGAGIVENTPERVEQPDVTNVDSTLNLHPKALIVPKPDHIITCKRGAVIVGEMFSASDVELHFYDKNSNKYKELFVKNGNGQFSYTTDFDMPEGRNAIHYRGWSIGNPALWFDSGWFVAIDPVTINPPGGNFYSPYPTITGRAKAGATVNVWIHKGAAISGTTTVSSTGNWSLNMTTALSDGQHQITAKQSYSGSLGEMWSSVISISVVQGSPLIYSPVNNTVINVSKPSVSGRGTPGKSIKLHEAASSAPDYGSVQVPTNGQWTLTLTRDLPEGRFTMVAKQVSSNGAVESSPTVTVTVKTKPLTPVITAPPANSVQNSPFTLSGTGGEAGAIIKVFRDLTEVEVGRSTPLAGSTWSAPITLQPGLMSIAASQTLGGKESLRSPPRTFKIPPPALTAFSAADTATAVTFSGAGYGGATVEISKVSGPGTTVPLPAPVTAGKWQTTATLLPGIYIFNARQSISDGGSGRIDSIWSPNQTVNVPTPPPTGMSAVVNGQKGTFSGRGRQWGTAIVAIEIRHKAALLPGVPHVDVQANLNWTVTATADHAPGTYVLTARQWVNNQWSADSATFSMIVASPAPVFTKPTNGAITGQLPQISGSAWANSAIALKISGKPDVQLTATGGTFILNAAENWAPRTYTLQATAVFGGQTSSVGSRTFTVKPPKPIVSTLPGAEVGLVAIIEGQGWEGCWVFIYSATHLELAVTQVGADKQWTAELAERQPGDLTFYAKQKETGSSLNVSDNTANITVKVRLAPPVILVPAENGRPARESVFSGSADPLSAVELYHEGETLPFLKDIRVNEDGKWEANVTLPAGGPITVIAKVRKGLVLSAPFPRIVTVVPAPPVIDTPSGGELVGRRLRISGFGYPGDKVRIDRRGNYSNIGNVDVTENGTWYADIAHGSTETVGISVLAQLGSLDSLYSPTITMAVLVGPPEITDPQAEDWVGLRPLYSGRAAPGASITVASSFNADDVLAPSTEADALGLWAVTGNKDLPVGEARVQVCQTLEGRRSEWVLSGRFMVERMAAGVEIPPIDFPMVGQEVGRYPMFSGTGVPGAEVTIITAFNAGDVLGTALIDRHGKWALRSEKELPVAQTLYSYSVRQCRDNVCSVWSPPGLTIKVIQVPAGFTPPNIELPDDDEAQVLERRPMFAGTGMPGAEVKVHKAQAATVYATARVDAEGKWSARCEVELPVLDVPHVLQAQQTMDGQDSTFMGTVRRFKVAGKIAPPVFVSPSEGAHVPINAVIRGTAMPGAEIRLYQSGNPNKIVGAGITDEQGHWVLVTGPLPVGAYQVTGKGFKGELVSGWMAARKFTVFEAG